MTTKNGSKVGDTLSVENLTEQLNELALAECKALGAELQELIIKYPLAKLEPITTITPDGINITIGINPKKNV